MIVPNFFLQKPVPVFILLIIAFMLTRQNIKAHLQQIKILEIGLSRDCPARLVRLKVVSIDGSLLQGVAPRFSADFVHHLSCERPFKFQRHLIQDSGCNKLISYYCTYLW
jgi:hypothetical protein